jgi:hypothetical protein
MPRFKSKCPFCSDNSWINWYHDGCSSNKGENIDIDGYLECNDCHDRWHLINTSFYCSSHSDWRCFTKKSQIRTLWALIAKIDNIDDDYLDKLQSNIEKEWDRTH